MKRIAVVGLLTLAFLRPGVAAADALTFNGTGKGASVSISGLASYNNVFAGELTWSWLGTPPAGFAGSFFSYCVDILHHVVSPQTVTVRSTNDMTPATSANTKPDAGGKAAWLFNTYATYVHNSGSNTQAAALQVAIWEVLYDYTTASPFNLAAGNFRVTASSAILSQANAYLQALYYAPGQYGTGTAVWLDSPLPNAYGAGQDQITQVPEPASLALLILGLGLAGRRLRRMSS